MLEISVAESNLKTGFIDPGAKTRTLNQSKTIVDDVEPAGLRTEKNNRRG